MNVAAYGHCWALLRSVVALALLLDCFPLWGAEPSSQALPLDFKVQLQWGVKVQLRDGVKLNATIYAPSGQVAPAPCILTLTPYISDSYHERGMFFASHGYPFAIVDVRGRGNSEGKFHPNIQEAHDGYDVVEWLARQAYCNGKIAMWGGSYAGYDQWATAKELPSHLATIVPVAAVYPGIDFPMHNNIFYPYVLQWLTLTSGRAAQSNLADDDSFWSSFYRYWYQSGRSFHDLDTMLGNPSDTFQEWLQHPESSDYWDAYNPTVEQYAQIKIPILTITGIYDGAQLGALENYSRHMRSASPVARSRHFLIIGPWDHDGTRTPVERSGGVSFGSASLLDLPKLHLDWYSWTMGNGPKPAFLKKPVAYYVIGANRWRYAETLAGITARVKPYYLDSTGQANDVFSSGSLRDTPGEGKPDSYRNDSRELTRPDLDDGARATGETFTDQSIVLAAQGKELVYHTAPFSADAEISGFFKLSAWISLDGPDTDFYASIYLMESDGGSIRLTTDAIRARYREGKRNPKLIRTRAPLRYNFDHFTFVSHAIRRGERLRLVIASTGVLSQATFVEKNYQGGGVVAEESVKDARSVTIGLFHDRTHPSALYVPFGEAIASVQ